MFVHTLIIAVHVTNAYSPAVKLAALKTCAVRKCDRSVTPVGRASLAAIESSRPLLSCRIGYPEAGGVLVFSALALLTATVCRCMAAAIVGYP